MNVTGHPVIDKVIEFVSKPIAQTPFSNPVIQSLCLGIFVWSIAEYSANKIEDYRLRVIKSEDPLHCAKTGYLAGIQKYIRKGKDLSIVEATSGNTLLIEAAANGHFGTVRELLVANSNPNSRNNAGETALHHACKGRFGVIVDLLLRHGAELNAKDENDFTPLMHTSGNGAVQIVEQLLKKEHIDIDAQNHKGQTALHLASKEYSEVVLQLLKKGASADLADSDGQIPLHYASDVECVGSLMHLLQYTRNVNVVDKEGNTALHLTAANIHGLPKSVEVLLKDPKVDPNILNKEGDSPLHIACDGMAGNHALALQMVAAKRFDLTLRTKNDERETPLERAKRHKAPALVEAIEKEMDVKKETSHSSITLLPAGAALKNGVALPQPSIEDYTKEELEKMQVGEFSLVEWTVVHCAMEVLNALNKKGVYFERNKEREKPLILGLFQTACEQFENVLNISPIRIKEFQSIFEEIKGFLKNPEFEKINETESLAILNATCEDYLIKQQILSDHKKRGTHSYGSEYISGNQFFGMDFLKKYLSLIPAHMKVTREELINAVPENARRLLAPIRSLEEIVQVTRALATTAF